MIRGFSERCKHVVANAKVNAQDFADVPIVLQKFGDFGRSVIRNIDLVSPLDNNWIIARICSAWVIGWIIFLKHREQAVPRRTGGEDIPTQPEWVLLDAAAAANIGCARLERMIALEVRDSPVYRNCVRGVYD